MLQIQNSLICSHELGKLLKKSFTEQEVLETKTTYSSLNDECALPPKSRLVLIVFVTDSAL
jgi:hypothetical protein